MIDVRLAVPGDYIDLAPGQVEPLEAQGDHYVWTENDTPFAAGGHYVCHPARAVTYLLWPKLNHKIRIYRDLRFQHGRLSKAFRRLECTVRVSRPDHLEFAVNMGYVVEGLLQAFDPESGEAHWILRYDSCS